MGALMAAEEFGVDVIFKGPQKEDDRAQQITVVEDFVSRGVSGIVLAPLDERALRRPVQDAVREKIPVVVIDSGLEGSDHVSYVATDNYQGRRPGRPPARGDPGRTGQDLPHPLPGGLGQHHAARSGLPRHDHGRGFRG